MEHIDNNCFSKNVINNIHRLQQFSGKKITILELFCGTKSFSDTCSKIFNKNNCNIVTLDIENRFNPNIELDILELDFERLFKKNSFDIIWASPECKEYSLCKTTQQRDLLTANRIVLKTIQIIKYLSPKFYFIENPKTGFLKQQDIMRDIPFYDVSYCMYSDFGYKKNTRIWTNIKDFTPLQCNSQNRCKHFVNGCHISNVQSHKLLEKYRVPEMLIFEVLKCTMFVPEGISIIKEKNHNTNNSNSNTNNTINNTDTVNNKRGPGRPPNDINKCKKIYQTKKGPGRPPKIIKNYVYENIVIEKKRGPGRPPKHIQ